MRYEQFEFKNFKGIQTMTLPLEGGVTTLIGLNESGKTTILEAIFCFSYGAEDLEVINPGMASLRDPEHWIPISQRANFNDDITITATVRLDDADKRDLRRFMFSTYNLSLTDMPSSFTITERYRFANSRHVDTDRLWALRVIGTKGRQVYSRNYSNRASPEWSGAVAHLKAKLPRIWYFPNFLFELPERFELHADGAQNAEERDKNTFYKTTFENILSGLGYGATLQTHVVERLKSTDRADQRSLAAVLLDMSRSITDTIFEGWNRIFSRVPTAHEVEIDADVEVGGTPFLELRIKGPDGYYDLSERSLGFRWFFMFLLMTSFQGDPGETKPLFLLDEPASNLHSTAQAELLKSFEKLLDKCYLIYTTHSHHLINIKWLDGAYVVKNAALGSLDFADYINVRVGARTSITATPYRRFVAEHPDQTSYIQPVLELLDYRPSVLEPVPNVVLVEGKSDFYFLRYVIDILGFGPEVRLVPGGGAGSLDALIRLHIGWGKSFVVLLDGDAEGKKQRSRYEMEFGPLVANRCLILPNVCADVEVREVEDLLDDIDKRAIISAASFEASGKRISKKLLQQSVVELYATSKTVELGASATERFEHLLRGLKSILDES